MKKIIISLGTALIALTVNCSIAFAANGHGLNPYKTPEFVRNPAQMANDTDLLSAAAYNPAGFVKFVDGFYIGLGNIVLPMSNEMVVASEKYEQDSINSLIPTSAIAYKKGKGAVFLNFEVFDGGGVINYKEYPSLIGGIGEAKGSSDWLQLKLGGAFELNEILSLTSGIRYMVTTQTAKFTQTSGAINPAWDGEVIVDDETKMDGQAGFFGLNLTPVKDALINFTYFTKGFVQGEKKHKADTASLGIPGGVSPYTEESRDVVPGYLTIGLSYLAMPELKISAGMNYVLTEEKKFGDGANETSNFANQKNAVEIAFGADYKVNDRLLLSGGYAYKAAGGNSETYDAEATNPDLDLQVIGIGLKVTPWQDLNLNLGIMKAFFKEGESVDGATTYNADAWLLSTGIDYKI